MYYGYRIDLEDFDTSYLIDTFFDEGNKSFVQNKNKIETNIQKYSNAKGVLDAAKIEEDWFPHVATDVFISHSSADANYAIAFAGMLKQKFGLDAFIDSCLWNHSEKLLKIIDDEYSNHPTDSKLYSYEKRNNSTGHVHTMLSMALAKMIFNTHCFMFIGSENSIHLKGLDNNTQTLSPWIYLELQLSKMLKKEPDKIDFSIRKAAAKDSIGVNIAHEIDFGHLTPLTVDDINTWLTEFKNTKWQHPLKVLFDLK